MKRETMAETRRQLAHELCWATRTPAASWRKHDEKIIELSPMSPSGKYLIISEYPDMPKVIDAMGFLPEGAEDVICISPDELDASPEALGLLEELRQLGSRILLDERTGEGAPLKTVPGSVELVRGHIGNYYKGDVRYFGNEIGVELARSLLKRDLALVCKRLYNRLVGLAGKGIHRQRKPKRSKMASINRCAEFAGLLTLGRADYSWFVRGESKREKQAKVMLDVTVPRKLFPEELRERYDEIVLLEEFAALWEAAVERDGTPFGFSYKDIDEGRAAAVMAEIGERIGIAEFVDAWEAGKPSPTRNDDVEALRQEAASGNDDEGRHHG